MIPILSSSALYIVYLHDKESVVSNFLCMLLFIGFASWRTLCFHFKEVILTKCSIKDVATHTLMQTL